MHRASRATLAVIKAKMQSPVTISTGEPSEDETGRYCGSLVTGHSIYGAKRCDHGNQVPDVGN
jgi:hypothetical protein